MHNKLPYNVRIAQKFIMKVRPAILATFLKKLLGITRLQFATKNGTFAVDPISQFGQTLLQTGVYEEDLTTCLSQNLKTGNTFLDIGANEGYFSVLAAKLVGSTGRVVTVEPQSRLQSVLLRNFELNQIRNYKLIQAAISDKSSDSEQFYESPDINTGSSGLRSATSYAQRVYTIKTMTMSELFQAAEIATVDLMKMDIEGFEYEAMLGAADLIKSKRIKMMAIEFHPRAMADRQKNGAEIINLLEVAGYRRLLARGVDLWGI